MVPPDASPLLVVGFLAIELVAVALVAAVVATTRGRRSAATVVATSIALSMGVFALARTGAFAHFAPPRLLVVFLPLLVGVLWVVRSPVGATLSRAPMMLLVGGQAFRIPVELLIHRAVIEGVAPPQLTWTGLNFDIVPALLALPVAVAATRGRRSSLLFAYHAIGLTTLSGVVVVALLSMPTPLQLLSPDNTWVAWPPFIGLPAILVTTAYLLHGLGLRALIDDRRARAI